MLPEASYCEAPPPLSILNAAVTPFASRAHAIRCISARVRGGGRALCVAIYAA